MIDSASDDGVPATNWRPTIPSTLTAAAIAVTATLGLAVVAAAVRPALIGVIAGVALATTVAAVGTADRRFTIVVGGLLATVAGLALLGSVVTPVLVQVPWPPTPPMEVLAIAPFAIAFAGVVTGFGIVVAVRDLALTTDGARAALRLVSVLPVPVTAVVVDQSRGLIATAVDALREMLTQLTAPTQPAPGIEAADPRFDELGVVIFEAAIPRFGELGALLFVAAFLSYVAVGRLPIVDLASDSTRPIAIAARRTVRRLLLAMMMVAGFIGVSTLLLLGSDPAPDAFPPAVIDVVITITYAPSLRRLLVAAAVVSAGTMCIIRTIRAIGSDRFRPSHLPVAPLAVGCLLTVAVVIAHDSVATIAVDSATTPTGRAELQAWLDAFGSFALLSGLVIAGLVTAVAATVAISFIRVIQLLGREPGTQLAAGGVFLAALAAGISDAPILIVFAGVATSLLVRDLGEFGGTLGREIGRAGTSRRTEIVHGVGAVALGGAAVGLGVGALVAIEYLPQLPDSPNTVAVLAASLGTLLLFLGTR